MKSVSTQHYDSMWFRVDSDYLSTLAKVKYRCKCGHKVIIPAGVKKLLCSWCGHYVFADKKEEFKAKFNEALKKNDKKYVEVD